jgi:hypothetical protein
LKSPLQFILGDVNNEIGYHQNGGCGLTLFFRAMRFVGSVSYQGGEMF